jgi:hypothetical protein
MAAARRRGDVRNLTMGYLAEATLEEVFRSTQQSIDAAPGPGRIVALVLMVVGLLVLFLVLQQRWQAKAVAKPVNHQGKLIKELKQVSGLSPAEMKKLEGLAEEHSLCSPLVLLLCPSMVEKLTRKSKPEDSGKK